MVALLVELRFQAQTLGFLLGGALIIALKTCLLFFGCLVAAIFILPPAWAAGGLSLEGRETSSRPVTMDQVPEPARRTLLKQAGQNPIRELEEKVVNGQIVYEIELRVDGREVEVVVAPFDEFALTPGDVATGSFRTANIPLGLTYMDPPQADPDNPGAYLIPDFPADRATTVVDPHTGAAIRRAVRDGDASSNVPTLGSGGETRLCTSQPIGPEAGFVCSFMGTSISTLYYYVPWTGELRFLGKGVGGGSMLVEGGQLVWYSIPTDTGDPNYNKLVRKRYTGGWTEALQNALAPWTVDAVKLQDVEGALAAFDPQFRSKPEYMPKSGAVDTAIVKVDPLGRVTAIMATTPQGQGHRTIVSQIVAEELGLTPAEVTVVDEMDTFTRHWSISSGTYSSRFASVGASAAALAARTLKVKLVEYAAHLMERPVDEIEWRDGAARPRGGRGPSYTVKDLAGRAHWHTESLPDGMEPGLQATATFGFTGAQAIDEHDRVNSSNTYGFIAEVMAVEIDPNTAAVALRRYVTVHDAGTILNPLIVEGQIYGGALHGLGGALYEEMAYDDDGQCLATTFMDYLVPTASEAPVLDIAHVSSPSPLTTLGSKGLGESGTMTVPAVVANAVSDALAPIGVRINELPITPSRLWELMQTAQDQGAPRVSGGVSERVGAWGSSGPRQQ